MTIKRFFLAFGLSLFATPLFCGYCFRYPTCWRARACCKKKSGELISQLSTLEWLGLLVQVVSCYCRLKCLSVSVSCCLNCLSVSVSCCLVSLLVVSVCYYCCCLNCLSVSLNSLSVSVSYCVSCLSVSVNCCLNCLPVSIYGLLVDIVCICASSCLWYSPSLYFFLRSLGI